MKKALLMFLILLTNIVSTNAQEEPASCFDWEEIVCNEFDMKKKKTVRRFTFLNSTSQRNISGSDRSMSIMIRRTS